MATNKKIPKKKSASKQAAQKKTAKKKSSQGKRKAAKKWSRKIKTDSTHPPEGLFTKDAGTIAESMASKKVSPGGIGSGIRMVQMFINRAGKNLEPDRKQELEKAKHKLQAMKKKAESKSSPRKKRAQRSAK